MTDNKVKNGEPSKGIALVESFNDIEVFFSQFDFVLLIETESKQVDDDEISLNERSNAVNNLEQNNSYGEHLPTINKNEKVSGQLSLSQNQSSDDEPQRKRA